MANSRLEKIGTIYSRTKGLIQSGALSWQDRPVWYDVYEDFPPKDEPRFDRPVPKLPLKKIFYSEDKVRAAFHKHTKNVGRINLLNTRNKSVTQSFIDIYQQLETEYNGSASHSQIFEEALEKLKKDMEKRSETQEDGLSLTLAFKEAQSGKDAKDTIHVNVKDIFKE